MDNFNTSIQVQLKDGQENKIVSKDLPKMNSNLIEFAQNWVIDTHDPKESNTDLVVLEISYYGSLYLNNNKIHLRN